MITDDIFEELNNLYETYDVISSCTKTQFIDTLLNYLKKNDLKFSEDIIPKAGLFNRSGFASHTFDITTHFYSNTSDRYKQYKIYFGRRRGLFNSNDLEDILNVYVDEKSNKVIQIDKKPIKELLPELFKNSQEPTVNIYDKLMNECKKFADELINSIKGAFLDHDEFDLEDQDLLFVSRLVKDKNFYYLHFLTPFFQFLEKKYDQQDDAANEEINLFADKIKQKFGFDIFTIDQDKVKEQENKLDELEKKYFKSN